MNNNRRNRIKKKIKILEIIEIVKRLVFTNVVYDLQLK